MADRVPLPSIAGLLDDYVDLDLFAAYFATAQTLTDIQPAVTDAPSGGSFSVDLRTAVDGGGDGLSATIDDGANVPDPLVTGSVAIPAGTTMYLRITAVSGDPMGFYGSFECDRAAGATAALTTQQRVKTFKGISGTDNDDTINTLIQGVSKRMQTHMRRPIVSQLISAEIQDANGLSDTIILDQYPVIIPPAVVVRRNGTVVDASTYVVDAIAGELILAVDGAASLWPEGRRAYSADYTSGYTEVPEDLVLWATKQVVHEFLQTAEGEGRLSLRGANIEPGGSGEYMIGQWVPGMLEAMAPYRNARIF
jgi:hypothetical protein